MSKPWYALALVALLFGATSAIVACGGEDAATGSGGTGTVEPPPEPPPAAPAPSASFTEAHFTLNAVAAGPYAPNTAGTFEIHLDTLAGFHVNPEYPWRVVVTTPTGVTTPAATIEGEVIALEGSTARIPVSFTAATPGTHQISCAVDYGICIEEQCEFDTRTLLVDVNVAEAAAAPPADPTAPPAPTDPAAES